MTTFNEFLSSFDPDAGKRGKQFEHFIKWFLKNDPKWATQVDQVWLWDEYPQRWGRDCGIDLVFKHKNGETWAVQTKCYAPTTSITKSDVDSFISESNRDGIDRRLLIATTDLIGANAKQVCDAQDKKVTRYLLSHFDESDIEYPASLEDLPKAKPKEKPQPREHQLEAIEAVSQNFKEVDRGQMIMACGTGKTFTTLWIKERLGADSVLVLLPSLGLLSQTLHEWTMAANEPFEVLCVCSDESVGKKSNDESVHSISDLAFPVTSNVDEIKAFLSRSGKKVIFATYQSSPLIAQAQADQSIPSFDLAIADEAHRCAGKVSGDFSTILNAEKIRSKRRLFTTATPRTYSSTVKKAAEDRGVEVVGMDDEVIFGKTLYALNFGEAIKRGLLTDYRVVIVGVDDPTISEWIENRELLKVDSGIEMDAESLAVQVGLLKAIKDYDLHRMISFHSRVSRAEHFSQNILKVIDWIDKNHRPSGELKSDFVSGEMPTDKRRRKLAQLKNLQDNQRGLLTNARCLSEGVDVPSLDGVAFIDPKSSQIDIIQAVGRAIRLSENKVAGTIILPVFISKSDDPEQALESSNFKPLWDVLNALKAHDDALGDELNQIRSELGHKGTGKVESYAFSKISIDLPVGIDQSFGDGLRTLLVEQTTASWEFWYGLLKSYSEVHGDCLVSARFSTRDSYKLGVWVSNQRNQKDVISAKRKHRLESLKGWSWDAHEAQWETGYAALKQYAEEHGDCLVHHKFILKDGYKLGQWVAVQRKQKDTTSPDRKIRLESLQGWSWDPFEDQWEAGYIALSDYAKKYGNCSVPQKLISINGYKLGVWVSNQRSQYEIISPDRKRMLENLTGWSWDGLEAQWETGYLAYKNYIEEYGPSIPKNFITKNGYRLKQWVLNQKRQKETISPERKMRLESLQGWSWEQQEAQWETGYYALKEYLKQNGNCLVQDKFITEAGYRLGQWVAVQRKQKNTTSPERKIQLEALKGWSWDSFEAQWEAGYLNLKNYAEQYGNCLVPQGFELEDGYKLGQWVGTQRRQKETISFTRKARLENLQGWAWDSGDAKWELGYIALKKYSEEYGNCLVPGKFNTQDGYKLGQWVGTQRRQKETISFARKARLENLQGWVWEVRAKLDA